MSSPYADTSNARKALERAKRECADDSELIESCRREYIRCIHNSVETVVFQVIASFLNEEERLRYARCSKFLHDEVVFGDGCPVLIWRHSSNDATVLAIARKSYNMALQLIRAGVGVENSRFGWTPLSVACARGQVDLVDALLKAKASVDERDCDGRTPLMIAAANGDHQIVKTLLMSGGASINTVQQDSNNTALLYACVSSNVETVKILLDAKADINATNVPSVTLSDEIVALLEYVR